MLRLIVISGLLALISLAGTAQDTIRINLGGYPVSAVVQGNDTVLIANLDEAVIQPRTNKPSIAICANTGSLFTMLKRYIPMPSWPVRSSAK
jgi:hypothetical protein